MTISLAAVFIPLVFMTGLVGRIFREFAITIVIAIFASGLVSLTLTPLMCARLLKARGEGSKKTWMERVIGGIEKRVLGVLRRIALVVSASSLDLAGDLGGLPGRHDLVVHARAESVPAAGRQQRDLRRVHRARRLVAGTDARASGPGRRRRCMQDPNVITDFTMTGATGFLASNQGITFTFIKPPEERTPIAEVTAEMMGKLNSIPGVITFLRPFPVLEISTGVTSQNQGQYAFAVSGANPESGLRSRRKADGQADDSIPGFLTVSSDLLQQHAQPRYRICAAIRRRLTAYPKRAFCTLLRNAYSQNYLYLIKKPEDQYQVILKMEDSARAKPEDLSLLYIKSDDGKRLVPLGELVTWKTTLGPQAVNHLNQFTSMTLFFNLKPGVALGDATELHHQGSG